MAAITSGMNVPQIRNFAGQLQRRAETVEHATAEIDRLVRLSRQAWGGEDSEQFEARWKSQHRATAVRVSTDLRHLAELARTNADAQERTSDELGASPSGTGAGGSGGGGVNPFGWVESGLAWVGQRVEEGVAWTTGTVADVTNGVVGWFQDRAEDVNNFVVPRIQAGLAGLDTFGKALQANAQAWDWRDGHPPQLAEVLSSGLLVLGTGAGLLFNIKDGKDYGFLSPGTPGAGQPRTVELGSQGMHPITDFNSLTQATMSSYENGVRVDKIVDENGTVRYIVSIPGTEADVTSIENGWSKNPNARNWAANLWAIAQGSRATDAQAVQMAIQNAGVPEGANIMLTGHSQGGIIAANLAADNGFASTYNIDGVITYGSPVETADLGPSSAPVLAFGHGNALNPTPNPIPVLNQVMPTLPFQIGDPIHQLDLNGVPAFPGIPWDKQGNITEIGLPPVGNEFFDLRANHEQQGYINDVAHLSPQNQAAVNNYMQQNGLGIYFTGTTTSTVVVETTG